jgi:hypothetical protein
MEVAQATKQGLRVHLRHVTERITIYPCPVGQSFQLKQCPKSRMRGDKVYVCRPAVRSFGCPG